VLIPRQDTSSRRGIREDPRPQPNHDHECRSHEEGHAQGSGEFIEAELQEQAGQQHMNRHA
jgi:hypothetical protein